MAVRINIATDFSGKGLERAKKEFSQLEGVGAKTAFALKKAFVPATAAIAGLVTIGKKAVDAASDLNEETSKTDQIFKQGSKEIKAFAKTAASALGQSRRQALQAASTFGVLGKAAGLTGKDLTGFSKEFTVLASDLASFNNTSPEDAILAIGAALRGEAEPIRRYGVLLNDATLRQKALEMGLIETTKNALDPQTKALAAAAVIMDQTKDAQGDFARTSDGFANSQRILTAQVEDFTAALGQALLPVMEQLLPILKGFAQWASENPRTFQIVAAAIGLVSAAVVALNVAMALNPFVLLGIGIAALVTAMIIYWPQIKKFFTNVAKEIDNILGPLDEILGFLFNQGSKAFGTLKDTFRGSKIPAMADGGVITSGPQLALIGEAGPEAVIPLDRLGEFGGGGTSVTINVNGGDPQAVVDALRRYMQINGSVPIRVS
jgi:hypothetical protein